MIFYPLYSESQRRIFKFVFFGAIVGMALGAAVISYLYPNSQGIGQQLFQFCCMLMGFYVAFSYFNLAISRFLFQTASIKTVLPSWF